jgi:hypothetical protein
MRMFTCSCSCMPAHMFLCPHSCRSACPRACHDAYAHAHAHAHMQKAHAHAHAHANAPTYIRMPTRVYIRLCTCPRACPRKSPHASSHLRSNVHAPMHMPTRMRLSSSARACDSHMSTRKNSNAKAHLQLILSHTMPPRSLILQRTQFRACTFYSRMFANTHPQAVSLLGPNVAFTCECRW